MRVSTDVTSPRRRIARSVPLPVLWRGLLSPAARVNRYLSRRMAIWIALAVALVLARQPLPAQVISSVQNPAGQQITSAPSGTVITINGSGFGNSTPQFDYVAFSTWWIAGGPNGVFGLALVSTWTGNSITLTIPQPSVIPPGTYQLTVNLWDGKTTDKPQTSNAVTFTIGFPQPVISYLSAGAQFVGGFYQSTPGETITVYGSNLGNLCTNCGNGLGVIDLTPVPAGASPTTVAYRYISDGEVAFTLPATIAPGNYALSLTNGAGTTSNPVLLIVGTGPSQPPLSLTPELEQSNNSQPAPLAGPVFVATMCNSEACGTTSYDWVNQPSSPTEVISESLTPLVPVQVSSADCTDPIVLDAQVWTDFTPVRADPNPTQDGTPDGNIGSWTSAGNLSIAPTNVTNTTVTNSHGGQELSCSWETPANVPATLSNPAAPNFLIFKAAQGTGTNTEVALPDVPVPQPSPGSSSLGWYTTWVEVQPVPLATVSLNAVPISIIYQPPGDLSSSYLTSTVMQTIQYTAGQGSQTSNSVTNSNNTCFLLSLVLAGEQCNGQATAAGSGFAQTWQGGTLESNGLATTWPAGPVNSYIPYGNPNWGGTYWNEPFWFDEFVFELNAQYAMFDNGGVPLFELVPGKNLATSDPIPLYALAYCVAGMTVPAGSPLGYTDACSVGGAQDLTQQQAWTAIQLDPFFLGGQSVNPSQVCTWTLSGNQCRARQLSSAPASYAENASAYSDTGNMAQTSSSYLSSANTYWATVTNTQLTSAGYEAKASFSPEQGGSLPAEMALLENSSNAATNGITLTYQSSTAASSTQSTSWGVSLEDWDNTHIVYTPSTQNCKTCHPPLNPPPTGPF
jgi:hypothetical protein